MSSVEEASPSRSRSSTSLDDESVVLDEKYMLIDGDYYPRWSSGDDVTFDCEDHQRVPSQAVTNQDHVLELLWNSRRNRGALEKIQRDPTFEIESAEYRTFGTWGHSPGQLSSLLRYVVVAKRNRRLLRQWKLRRYDERNYYNRTYYDASSIDCAGKLLLELGSRLRGHLAPIALALDRDNLDRGELREASDRPTLFQATTLRIENGSATRRRYYSNDVGSPKTNSQRPKQSKPLSARKRSARFDQICTYYRLLIRKL